ncbi:MAG: Holliday junction resolvase RuvX [Acutalibacteraceae bacterium]|nr:Holliday junction resolvase RuvX [Acutalibacteraceae bacterium]
MIIMSVDRGKARTGIAYSDMSESFAFPSAVITEYNEEKLVDKIKEEAIKLGAQLIVVGLPKRTDGTLGDSAQECLSLAEKLKEATGLNVEMYDERFTTVSAHIALNQTNTRGKKRKAVVDAVAATMILEDYLAFRKRQKM